MKSINIHIQKDGKLPPWFTSNCSSKWFRHTFMLILIDFLWFHSSTFLQERYFINRLIEFERPIVVRSINVSRPNETINRKLYKETEEEQEFLTSEELEMLKEKEKREPVVTENISDFTPLRTFLCLGPRNAYISRYRPSKLTAIQFLPLDSMKKGSRSQKKSVAALFLI